MPPSDAPNAKLDHICPGCEALRSKLVEVTEALELLIDPAPCTYNRTGGYCSTHGKSKPCCFDIARAALAVAKS